MKRLHRKDLYCWSVFSEENNIDFHSLLWVRDSGNILVDPLPLSLHDETRLNELGSVALIIVTNSDHVRDAVRIADRYGGKILGPIGERHNFPIQCADWLSDGDEVIPGLRVFEMHGSKTPGELALLLEDTTLIAGDLIRCHLGGELTILPEAKLSDKAKVIMSIERLLELNRLETIFLGDGWPIFHNAKKHLAKLLRSLRG